MPSANVLGTVVFTVSTVTFPFSGEYLKNRNYRSFMEQRVRGVFQQKKVNKLMHSTK